MVRLSLVHRTRPTAAAKVGWLIASGVFSISGSSSASESSPLDDATGQSVLPNDAASQPDDELRSWLSRLDREWETRDAMTSCAKKSVMSNCQRWIDTLNYLMAKREAEDVCGADNEWSHALAALEKITEYHCENMREPFDMSDTESSTRHLSPWWWEPNGLTPLPEKLAEHTHKAQKWFGRFPNCPKPLHFRMIQEAMINQPRQRYNQLHSILNTVRLTCNFVARDAEAVREVDRH